MCLIIHKPSTVKLTKEQLNPVFTRNGDGFGVMYIEENRVKIEKILPSSIDDIMTLVDKHASRELGIHFRMKTHGAINVDNAHPYKLFTVEDGAPFDAYLMHNGIFSGFTTDTVEHSDTYNFIQKYVMPLIESDGYDIVHTKTFLTALAEKASTSNKLLLATPRGFKIINKEGGNETKIEGAWCSNTYAFGYDTPAGGRFQWGGSDEWSNYSGYRGGNYAYPPLNRPWGTLPFFFNKRVPCITPVQTTPPLVAKPITQVDKKEEKANTPSTQVATIPKEKVTTRFAKPIQPQNSYMPGIGPYDYTELATLEEGELFAAIVEHPEDVFDIINQHVLAIEEAIDEQLYEDD